MNQDDSIKAKIKYLESQGYLQRADALRLILKQIKERQDNEQDNDNTNTKPSS